MKAVWSAQRMELEKIRLHPRVIVFPEQARARRPPVLLKGKVRPNDQAKPIKQPALLLPGNLTVLSLNYRAGGKISFEQLSSAIS